MENKKKAIGFYVGSASAAVALITGVFMLVYTNVVKDINLLPPVLLLVGVVIAAIGLVKDIPALAILPAACYMASLAFYLSSQLNNISGRLSGNGIGVTNTTLGMLILFCVLMGVGALLALVASFMTQYSQAA